MPRAKRDADGFTPFERRFAAEYLALDLNGAKAYIKASDKKPKPTMRTAEVNASRLLKRPEIQTLIKETRDRLIAQRDAQNEERQEEAELSAKETLEKLRQFLMYDARDVFDEHRRVKPMSEWPKDVAAACIGVKETQWGTEIKFVDKSATLEKALKYHGLFERDNRQRTDPITELFAEIYGGSGGSARLPVKG